MGILASLAWVEQTLSPFYGGLPLDTFPLTPRGSTVYEPVAT